MLPTRSIRPMRTRPLPARLPWPVAAAWLLAALLVAPRAFAAEDFIAPEQAFRYTTEASGDRVTIRWKVAKGYYLYRKRLGVESRAAWVMLGEPQYPKGESHSDEYFGEQEVYRGDFVRHRSLRDARCARREHGHAAADAEAAGLRRRGAVLSADEVAGGRALQGGRRHGRDHRAGKRRDRQRRPRRRGGDRADGRRRAPRRRRCAGDRARPG